MRGFPVDRNKDGGVFCVKYEKFSGLIRIDGKTWEDFRSPFFMWLWREAFGGEGMDLLVAHSKTDGKRGNYEKISGDKNGIMRLYKLWYWRAVDITVACLHGE